MRPLGHAECLTLPGFRMRRGEKPNDSAILMAEWLWTIKGPGRSGAPVAANRSGRASSHPPCTRGAELRRLDDAVVMTPASTRPASEAWGGQQSPRPVASKSPPHSPPGDRAPRVEHRLGDSDAALARARGRGARGYAVSGSLCRRAGRQFSYVI